MSSSHHILQKRIATPLGAAVLARSAKGISGLWFDDQKHHPGPLNVPQVETDPLLDEAEAALLAYFEGQALPRSLLQRMDPRGTPFQREVWQALLAIGAGESASYGGLARKIGRPNAVRALGAAVGRNPVSILIPCHRVLGAAGELTGYAGGLARKKAMLRLEGVKYKE